MLLKAISVLIGSGLVVVAVLTVSAGPLTVGSWFAAAVFAVLGAVSLIGGIFSPRTGKRFGRVDHPPEIP